MISDAATIRRARDRRRWSICTVSPIWREPIQSCATIAHEASVVPSAAAMKPMMGDRPMASPAFTTMATSA